MYIMLMQLQERNSIGQLIKQKRQSIPLTLIELSNTTGVSQSHLGRIERGERFPSAYILRRLAKPLGFEEEELFMMAGFLSAQSGDENTPVTKSTKHPKLDPYVANVLAQEPPEIQRSVIGILSLLKTMSRAHHSSQVTDN
jgi:transcriptional regulator with XRE-family HTH domain